MGRRPRTSAKIGRRVLNARVGIGVPPTTLVRLAQRLGLPGYNDLKRRYVEAMRKSDVTGIGGIAASRSYEGALSVTSNVRRSGGTSFSESVFAAEHEVLRLTFSNLDMKAIEEVVTALATARHVYIVGRRITFAPAYALRHALHKARPGVILIDDVGGMTEIPLEDASPEDLLVAITFAPFNRRTLLLAQQAHDVGVRVVSITDVPAPAFRKIAGNFAFVVASRGGGFVDSIGGVMAFANVLSGLTVAHLGEPAQQRIALNEQRVVASGEYLLAGPRHRRTG